MQSPRFRPLSLGIVLLFGLGAVPAAVHAGDDLALKDLFAGGSDAWQAHKKKDGVLLEKRKVAGSSFVAYRAVANLPLQPAAAADLIWRGILESKNPLLKKRDVLRRSDNELLLYDQIHTPVVSDRDYTLLARRLSDAGAKRYQVIVQTKNDLGPPPDPGFVRIPRIEGGWLIESCDATSAVSAPTPEAPCQPGGSRLTYVSYSEPGGSVPAFVVRGAQADQTLNDVLRVIDRLRKGGQ